MGVGVIIPVGSVDRRLDRQLHAVLAQELGVPYEVVLALNTPFAIDAERLMSRFSPGDGRSLRVVDVLGRRGAAYARNAGARATSADVLVFCDADDLVHPGWLASLVRGLEDFDAVTGHVEDVFPDARTASWHPPATPGELPRFLGRPYVLTGNLAVRRDAFDSVGGFDENLTRCEDIAFGWAMTRAGYSIGFAPDAVISYHHRAGLRSMLRQHYLYGRGMSETLARYGSPTADGMWAPTSTPGLMRANGQRAAKRTLGGTARRGAIALGRLHGALEMRVTRPAREMAGR
jgi:glycosyltransferase involved in cell wall biosynthesis